MKLVIMSVDSLLKSFAQWQAGTGFWKHKIFLALFYILIMLAVIFTVYIVIPFEKSNYLSVYGLVWGILIVFMALHLLTRYRLFAYTQKKLGDNPPIVDEEKIESLKKAIKTNNILIVVIILFTVLSGVAVYSLQPQLNLFRPIIVVLILGLEYTKTRLYRKLLDCI